MLKSYKKIEMTHAIAHALTTTTNRHSKIAYAFTLDLLRNLPDDIQFTIRQTENALNIGDIGECSIKYHITSDIVQRYALANESDIANALRNEVKVFSNSNRYPNATIEPKGFIAISKYGVHYITKKLAAMYWNDDRMHIDSNGNKQFTLAILKDMLTENKVKLLKDLTEKIFG